MKHSQPFHPMSIHCSFEGMAANCRRASFTGVSLAALFPPRRSPVFYSEETLPASVFWRRSDYSLFYLMTLAGFCMEAA